MRQGNRNAMRAVKVNKKDLLETVKANKVQHEANYVEAVEDYKVATAKLGEENLEIAKKVSADSPAGFKAWLPAPRNYAKDYDRAIRMLEMSVDEEIELEEHIFNQLVLDEWDWKAGFAATNAIYKSVR